MGTGLITEITFRDALAETETTRRHLLLGNGFSIAAYRRFSYSSLYEVAVGRQPSLAPLFERLGTHDFERVLRAAVDGWEQEELRTGLLAAIAHVHPSANDLTRDASHACASFLENFSSKRRGGLRGDMFTTNYDLLLYWVLVRENARLKCYDAFDNYGVWSPTSPCAAYYLHGALHLLERPAKPPLTQVTKMLWEQRRPLPQQIRQHLDRRELPIFVSEGWHSDKRARISRDKYLRHARRRLMKACDEPNSALFVVGHSLSETDQHITEVLGTRALQTIYVGCHSHSDRAQLASLAEAWSKARRLQNLAPLRLRSFDSHQCTIWGPADAVRRCT